jgi:AcrR family transcriptional regulator
MNFDKNVKRKAPRQQRARMTVRALEQAFVRVLMLHGDFQKIRVREVVELAGVGIGAFYGYFSNLQALAAFSEGSAPVWRLAMSWVLPCMGT